MKSRTSAHGFWNWVLLICGSIAQGAVSIWSMHFVGMKAVSLWLPSGTEVPFAFEPGLTVLSRLLSILVIIFGFFVAGDPNNQSWARNIVGGILCGGGVSVMHYV